MKKKEAKEKKRPTPKATKAEKAAIEKDSAATYNAFKDFEGKRYTGMKIGRSHKWYYDQGIWKETKLTPDEWGVSFAVTKRRAGKAPEGSGVPVGTEYHWYILAHQNVTKLDANSYSTSMTGVKFKLAHKRAGSEKWSVTDKTQRKRLIRFLQEMIAELQKEPEPVKEEAAATAAPAEKKTTGIAAPPVRRKREPTVARRLNGRTKRDALTKSRTNKKEIPDEA